MGIFNQVRKLLRGNKPMPNEHGPRFKLINESELFDKIIESAPTTKKVTVKVVPATTSDKADCVCGSGKCKCEDNKIAYAKAVAEKQKAASKTKPVAKKPVAKTTAKKEAIKKDLADTPVAKKPAPKKSPAKPSTSGTTPKKPTPKKK
jgi:hypothetical protein